MTYEEVFKEYDITSPEDLMKFLDECLKDTMTLMSAIGFITAKGLLPEFKKMLGFSGRKQNKA